jgi:hypothetical protein
LAETYTVNLLTILFRSSFEKQSEKTRVALEYHAKRFENEARVIIDEITVISHRDLNQRLPISMTPTQMRHNAIAMPRNDLFFGRDDILLHLHQDIGPDKGTTFTRQKSCVLNGLAGAGKTQTAIEYTYRYRDEYQYIFWLRSESLPELAENYSAIASAVGLFAADPLADQRRNIEYAWKWLSETGMSQQI